jgi:hypothetical protein
VVVRAGVYNNEIITYLKSFNEECTILWRFWFQSAEKA